MVQSGIEVLKVDQFVDQPYPQRPRRIHPCRGEQHPFGRAGTDQVHQSGRVRLRVDQAQAGGWHGEQGVRGAEPQVTGRHERDRAPGTGPRDPGHGRQGAVGDRLRRGRDTCVVGQAPFGTPGVGAVLRDVGTGAEHLVGGRAQDHHPCAGDRLGMRDQSGQVIPHLLSEGVGLVGTVQDQVDRSSLGLEDQFRRHVGSVAAA